MATLLVVDDDQQVRKMLGITLKRAGYEVMICPDGDEAIEMLRREKVDLVITDIIMPEKEGLATIIDIKKTFPDLPVIAISGGGKVGPESYLNMAHELGAVETFTKPIPTPDLLAAIERQLSHGQ